MKGKWWFVVFSQGKLQALKYWLHRATKPSIACLTRQSTGMKNLWRFCAVALKLHFSTKSPQVSHPVIAALMVSSYQYRIKMNKKNVMVVSLITIVIITVTAGYFSKNRYDSLLKSTSEGLVLGKIYGKSISQNNCMMGIRMKYSSCNETACELSANGYIYGCMNAAKKDEFCNGVPGIAETKRTLNWAQKTCSEINAKGSKCIKYIQKFVILCTEQNENRKVSTAEAFKEGLKKGYIENSK